MAAPKLQGDQYPGLDEDQVRQVVIEEHLKLVEILRHEVASQPARADGNLFARDFDQTLDIVERKLRSRIVV